jgi:hypothetical protein
LTDAENLGSDSAKSEGVSVHSQTIREEVHRSSSEIPQYHEEIEAPWGGRTGLEIFGSCLR